MTPTLDSGNFHDARKDALVITGDSRVWFAGLAEPEIFFLRARAFGRAGYFNEQRIVPN